MDPLEFWFRVATLAGLTCWTWLLLGMDFRAGEMGASFIHRPLLVFHEAGHVVFMPFGQWVSVLGGTLGQLIMPVILAGALLFKNQDPFGAAIGLWFLGVSLLDIAPYMFDALHPQLTLLSGTTGEAGGHDWVFLFSSVGWLEQSQRLGAITHKLGALTATIALGWAIWLLQQQYARRQRRDSQDI